ncbi:helix-turn-helix domain-containing protein [Radiobacillus sp. PE A8.2]|uniref:helix-turn-helix domain-containing protein n=1 Tax=Radiobacillus sp. PE A8.2 TaxID=3380349 RepID=UPI00388FD929
MKILFSGYSYHTNGYYASYKSGMDAYLIRLQTEGECKAIIKGKTVVIEKGDVILVGPYDHYELIIQEGQKSGDYHLICTGEWMDTWYNASPKPSICRIDLDEKLLSIWRYIIAEERKPSSEKNTKISNYLLCALCLSLERAITEKSPSSNRPYVVTRMMRYIEEHATTPSLRVEDVANHAALSVSRSIHLFKAHVSKTIMEYAQEIRLSTAVDQMRYTTLTLENIAHNCGFGTYSYFHRVFKKQYGVAPGVYRNRD